MCLLLNLAVMPEQATALMGTCWFQWAGTATSILGQTTTSLGDRVSMQGLGFLSASTWVHRKPLPTLRWCRCSCFSFSYTEHSFTGLPSVRLGAVTGRSQLQAVGQISLTQRASDSSHDECEDGTHQKEETAIKEQPEPPRSFRPWGNKEPV